MEGNQQLSSLLLAPNQGTVLPYKTSTASSCRQDDIDCAFRELTVNEAKSDANAAKWPPGIIDSCVAMSSVFLRYDRNYTTVASHQVAEL